MKKQLLIIPSIIFFSILFIFFYLLIIERNPSELPSNLINRDVPKFETESLLKNENFVSTKEFGNEVVLVNFFATWCKPCRDEHKYFQRFSNERRIRIIGINYKDNPNKALEWLQNLGNPYSSIGIDKNGRIAIEWGVYGIPETFIVNSNGIIKYKHVGPITNKIYQEIILVIKNI